MLHLTHQLGHLLKWIFVLIQPIHNLGDRISFRLYRCGLLLHRWRRLNFFCDGSGSGLLLLLFVFLIVVVVSADILAQLVVHLPLLLIHLVRRGDLSLKLICFNGF